MPDYAFGDNDLALQRLQVLAAAFAPSTRIFVRQAVPRPPALAIDLGCGPGYTTHLLHATLNAKQSIGLDNLERFIAVAKRAETKQVTFQRHDVTQTPFPSGPAELLYCRFLLTHLKEPEQALTSWATQLRPGGVLVAEEVERIETTDPVFTKYLPLVDAVLGDSHRLNIGAALEVMKPSGLRKRSSKVARIPIATGMAAKMFHLNMQTWKANPEQRQRYNAEQLEAIENGLLILTTKTGRASEITWSLRQLVWERT